MSRVVVTGFGVATPIGLGVDNFFTGLSTGICAINTIKNFPCQGLEIQIAAEIKNFTSQYGDRKIDFAMLAADEAMKMAHETSLCETLLHVGSSLELFNISELARQKIYPELSELLRANASPNVRYPLDAAGKIIIKKFGIPLRFLNNVSACAVGVQTIGHAFRSIRDGLCCKALAGGFDSMINPLGVGGFQLLGALSPNGCFPFDADRNGLVLSEGAGMFFLEELQTALNNNKKIYGEICGYGSTLDAYNLSAPPDDGEGAARAMTLAINDAKITPQQIDLLNSHGTGTPLNDPAEAAAIRNVFGEYSANVPIVAIKSQIGHLIAAAGAVELASCIYSFTENMAPGNIGLAKPGRGCELNHITKVCPWQGEVILSNSFGFGGQNGSIVLRRYHG
jgi:3-oxoacyl-[acyl-carrier-protein] synthase II